MLKNKDFRELVDEIINIAMEIEMFECGNSVPPTSWHVSNLRRRGIRYYDALPWNVVITHRFNELVEACQFLPINTDKICGNA